MLIAVGARFDDRVTGKLNAFAPHAKVIHMDIDPAEMSKLRRAHVALQGDLKALLPALQRPLNIAARQQQVAVLKAEHACRYDHPGQPIYAPLFLRQLSARKPANSVVTTDVGQHQMWSAQHMTFERPENFITSSASAPWGSACRRRWGPDRAPARYGDLRLGRWLLHDERTGAGHHQA